MTESAAKLTAAQRETLEWIGANEQGVDGIHDKRVATNLMNKGLVHYSLSHDAWFITEAGRAAISSSQALDTTGER